MTVGELTSKDEFRLLCAPHPEREIDGVYIGDLLSWVMGRAETDNAWITIMSNLNVIAVATLVDTSCVILAEGVMPDDEFLKTASAKEVNIVATDLSIYDAAIKLAGMKL